MQPNRLAGLAPIVLLLSVFLANITATWPALLGLSVVFGAMWLTEQIAAS